MGKRAARYIMYDVTSMTRDGDNLSVKLVAAGGLEKTANGIQIKSGGVTDAMLAGNISFNKLADYNNIARLDQNETIVGLWNFPDAANTPTINGKKISTQEYVDLMVQGLKTKGSARVMSDSNLAISGVPANVDGVTNLADGDLILLQGQTDASQNGLWIIRSGAWDRPDNYATGTHAASAYAFVSEGTQYADTGWSCITDAPSDVIDTDDVVWGQFTGMGTITPGAGLAKNGNTLYVVPSQLTLNGNAEIDGDTIGIDYTPQNFTADTTPVEVTDPKHLTALIAGLDNAVGGVGQIKPYKFTCSATDITNKYKDLPNTPKTPDAVRLTITQGGAQVYGDDFVMDGVVTNRLTWAGLGLDGVIATGDTVIVHYDL